MPGRGTGGGTGGWVGVEVVSDVAQSTVPPRGWPAALDLACLAVDAAPPRGPRDAGRRNLPWVQYATRQPHSRGSTDGGGGAGAGAGGGVGGGGVGGACSGGGWGTQQQTQHHFMA